MKKLGFFVFVGVVCIFILGLLMQGTQPYSGDSSTPNKISVVLYGESAERWTSLNQGIRHACSELGIEETILTVYSENDYLDQISLVEREVDSGAKGLLVAVSNSSETQRYLEDLSKDVSIVTVENGTGELLPYVGADDYEMGKSLAQSIAAETRELPIIILSENLHRQSVWERYQGFLYSAKDLNIDFIIKDKGDMELSDFIAQEINTFKYDGFVAFDNYIMEAVLDAALQEENPCNVYGVGNSEKIVHYMDQGIVKKLCYQNEFEIGYIGIYRLALELGITNKKIENDIAYIIVSKDNMYDEDVQHFIFPVI